jgi:hypothetical protein
MTSKDDPICPVPGTLLEGLTKREIFAMVAMQGLLACPHSKGDLEKVANESVTAANFLVAVLNSRHD